MFLHTEIEAVFAELTAHPIAWDCEIDFAPPAECDPMDEEGQDWQVVALDRWGDRYAVNVRRGGDRNGRGE